MDIGTSKATEKAVTTPFLHRHTATRVSRGGLDEINPDDIVYGEYSSGDKSSSTWLDVIYLDNDILRSYSGPVSPKHPVIEELKILLRSEDLYYLVPIKEVAIGLAFKRTDIVTIKVTSLISGTEKNMPSCTWEITFQDSAKRSLETNYQSYFAYGNTVRPASMTNASLLDKVFASNSEESK